MEFNREKLEFQPTPVAATNVMTGRDITSGSDLAFMETDTIVNKLIDHLAIIQNYRDRIDAFDFLIENAKKLAGNLRFETEDEKLISAINALDGDGPYVDLALFEKAIDIVIENFESMAVMSFTGVTENGR